MPAVLRLPYNLTPVSSTFIVQQILSDSIKLYNKEKLKVKVQSEF